MKTGYYKFIEDNDAYRRLDMRHIIVGGAIFIGAGIGAFIATHQEEEASAADLSKFQPGYIMSDYVMTNYQSMTEAEIQAFLKSKNPCNNTRIEDAKLWPKAVYNIKDGHFVCMADDVFENKQTGKMETAAHIIWQAAQDYQINPQVLITLLQKEQSLITDTWPADIQYRAATGYGCPDTAACDSKYYGFYNQVRNAAALFHTVMTGGWTNYPVGNNYIQYSPDKNCGGSIVNIQNLATSALYRYTPYQPNQAALDAYTGTATCGAYGNRNFYRIFEDWFGSTTATETTKTEENSDDGVYESFEDYVSKMGEKISEPKDIKVNGKDVTVQEFSDGMLIETEKRIYRLPKNIYTKWNDSAASLGNIKSNLQSNEATGMQWYDFENGKIVGNDKKGWFISKGKSREVWSAQGFEGGALGFPTSEIKKAEATGMEWQEYEGGQIVGNDKKGWFVSMGKSREAWAAQGFEYGALGFPTSNIKRNAATGMEWQEYEGGQIVGNDKKGWFVSMGKSRETWAKLGFEYSALGFPTSNFSCNTATGMCWQSYEGGMIVGNDKKGWYESRGNIRNKWQKAGFEYSNYGFPTSNIIDGNRQTYEGGTIWN